MRKESRRAQWRAPFVVTPIMAKDQPEAAFSFGSETPEPAADETNAVHGHQSRPSRAMGDSPTSLGNRNKTSPIYLTTRPTIVQLLRSQYSQKVQAKLLPTND
ncbi:hypothetical protein ZHAS_00006205 [Anopheles sinensis]|uniref:Uncharacterized protein n=1 Tax=Anopheles sinensis TaxID=74873 RepID=A0A084VLP5_ANOSI|nr:hypothetical protein ZHAS_00006205 [Anopheles sinensis]